MTTEERLRQVLEAEASHVDPATEWSDVERDLAARRRTRRFRQAALSTVAAAALVAGVLAVVSANDDRDSGLRVVPPATRPTLGTTSTIAAPTTTRPAAASGTPKSIVAWRDGTLLLLDSNDGHVVRELTSGHRTTWSGRVVLGPDDRAYFSDGTAIFAVPLSGGAVERVADGRSLAFSPNRELMAYESTADAALVIRTLANGHETRHPQSNPEQSIFDLSFANDWTVLLETSMPEGPGEIYRFDIQRDRAIGDATRLGPPDALPAGSGWYSARLRASNGLVGLVESCCALDANSYDGGSSFAVIDPRSGAVQGRAEFAFRVAQVEYDATGRHMLLIGRTPDGAQSTLYRRTGGSAPVLVAENIWTADW